MCIRDRCPVEAAAVVQRHIADRTVLRPPVRQGDVYKRQGQMCAVDPEDALHRACDKFDRRFRYVEQHAQAPMSQCTSEALLELLSLIHISIPTPAIPPTPRSFWTSCAGSTPSTTRSPAAAAARLPSGAAPAAPRPAQATATAVSAARNCKPPCVKEALYGNLYL